MRHIKADPVLPKRSHLIMGRRQTIGREIELPIFQVTADIPLRDRGLKGEELKPNKSGIRVGITSWRLRPSPSSFLDYPSVGTVASSIEQMIERYFDAFYLGDIRFLPEEDKKESLREFLRNADVAVACVNRDDDLIYRIRDMEGLDVPIAWIPLGNISQGCGSIKLISPYLRRGDTIWVSCSADKRILERFIRRTDAQIHLLHFGVECDIYRPLPDNVNRMTRLAIGVPPDAPLLLYCGRINIAKNVHALLPILEEVVKEEKEAMLCIAGPVEESGFSHFKDVPVEGYYAYLRKEIARRGLGRNVVIVGNQPVKSLVALYSAADVFVNCTINQDENFGLSQVEAMACGTPVVCTDWGGLKDTVVDGETGFRIETIITRHGIKVNWRRGVECILKLLRDAELRRWMGENGIRRARELFSLEVMGRRIVEIIESMASKKGEGISRMQTEFSDEGERVFRDLKEEKEGIYRESWGECLHLYPAQWSFESYKMVLEPYASYIAEEVDLRPEDVPTLIPTISLDGYRLNVLDPIWPCAYELDRWERDALLEIDGRRSISEISDRVGIPISDGLAYFKRLIEEGIAWRYRI